MLVLLDVQTKRQFTKPIGTYSGADVGLAEDAYEIGTTASVRSFDDSRVNFNAEGREPQFPTLSSGSDNGGSVGVRDVMDELYGRQDCIALALMRGFAEMFNLPPRTFLQHFTGGEDADVDNDGGGGSDLGTIRLLHYPAAESADEVVVRAEANMVGIAPHTDFEFFTLMHQRQPGLQFLVRSASSDGDGDGGSGSIDGCGGGGAAESPLPSSWEWVDAPVDDAFVVVAGDMLERFTNGVVKALPHRVVHTPHARDSIIRFNALKADTVVAPLGPFVTEDRPARYTPVTMKMHMDTTMENLRLGKGAWAPGTRPGDPGWSLTATYRYGPLSANI
jgi:isopenicillin N synthase-like dioxygenase